MNELTQEQRTELENKDLQVRFENILLAIGLPWMKFTPEMEKGVVLDNLGGIFLGAGILSKIQITDGRRAVLIGTPVGTVVIFEEFLKEGTWVLLAKLPEGLRFLYPRGNNLNLQGLYLLINPGDVFNNIGRNLGILEANMVSLGRIAKRKEEEAQEREAWKATGWN